MSRRLLLTTPVYVYEVASGTDLENATYGKRHHDAGLPSENETSCIETAATVMIVHWGAIREGSYTSFSSGPGGTTFHDAGIGIKRFCCYHVFSNKTGRAMGAFIYWGSSPPKRAKVGGSNATCQSIDGSAPKPNLEIRSHDQDTVTVAFQGSENVSWRFDRLKYCVKCAGRTVHSNALVEYGLAFTLAALFLFFGIAVYNEFRLEWRGFLVALALCIVGAWLVALWKAPHIWKCRACAPATAYDAICLREVKGRR